LYTENPDTLTQLPARKENHLVTVLSLAMVLGMAVAIAIYLAWSRGMLAPAFHGAVSMVALFVCPPYILSIAVGPTAEADLMSVVTAGTIVFANGFLYAGVAAGAYYVFTLLGKRGRPRP
jgi:drug/metabolite transporter (DMT)-like permease